MKKYRFKVAEGGIPAFKVRYSMSDRWLKSTVKCEGVSVLIYGLIEACIDSGSGAILSIDGYEDSTYWKQSVIKLPKVALSTIRGAKLPSNFPAGAGVDARLYTVGNTKYDRDHKILLLGDEADLVYQLCSNVYVGLEDNLVQCLYFTDIDLG